MNEIGTDCPSFVAKNISLLPVATPDAFDLAKITNNIGEVMKLESTVLVSFDIGLPTKRPGYNYGKVQGHGFLNSVSC